MATVNGIEDVVVFVDTSAWWGYFDRGDQYHRRAEETLRELLRAGERLITSDDVFDELVTGLLGRVGYGTALKAGSAILTSRNTVLVTIDAALFQQGWALFQRFGRIGLSFTDCTSMAVIRARSIERVFSFDKDFKRVGCRVIP